MSTGTAVPDLLVAEPDSGQLTLYLQQAGRQPRLGQDLPDVDAA